MISVRKNAAGLTLLVGAAVFAGCAQPVDDRALFLEAETLCMEREWDSAQVLLKDYLLRNPDNAGAHFYLGRTHLFAINFRPILAEGEFQTALQLYKEGDGTSPIPRLDAKYFELMCSVESAKASLMHIEIYTNNGVPLRDLTTFVDEVIRYADQGRKLFPNSDEIAWLDSLIQEFSHELFPPRVPRRPRIPPEQPTTGGPQSA